MRLVALLAAMSLCAGAEDWSLYVCMATTKNYVVGAKLLDSGVFRRVGAGQWRQTGHPDPFTFSLDYDRRDPARLYVAAGNGLIAMQRDQRPWRVLTGSDVTEMRDVVVTASGDIYYGYAAGVRVSRDRGASWKQLYGKYTEVVRVAGKGQLLIGTSDGIWRSEDDGASWKLAGADGFSVMDMAQSPHDTCQWVAATERGGLFGSRDCGKTFENLGRFGVGNVLYDVDFDSTTPGRVLAAGWGVGVGVSDDSGKSWRSVKGLPSTEIWSAAFDPGKKGRLFAGVHEQALYVSEDGGATWKPDGLEGTVVYRMMFVPEVKR